MAKQNSHNKMKGTIGDLTYYESKHGHLVRKKGRLNKERIMNDPAFARTRENLTEFGRAGSSGKLLRTSQRLLIRDMKDGTAVARLQKLLMQILRADPVNARGERSVQEGPVQLLEGFNFNAEARLSESFNLGYTVTIDRATGEVTVALPDFVPTEVFMAPPGSTHVRLLVGSSELNYDSNTFISDQEKSAWLPVDPATVTALDLVVNLSQNSTEQIYTFLGVEYAQEVNGTMYPMSSGQYNALAIVDVDTV